MRLCKKHMKYLIKSIILLMMLGLTGMILLAMVFMLPTRPIRNHVQNSFAMLEKETDWFSVTQGMIGTQQDNYSEAIYLNEAMVGRDDAGLWECVLAGYRFHPKELNVDSPVIELKDALLHPENADLVPLSRCFFNGYEVLLKPILLVRDYSDIRKINLFAVFFLSLLLCYWMDQKGMRRYILPTLIAILFINPLTIALSMTFFGYYCCMMIPCIIILRSDKTWLQRNGWILFEVTGACAFYFNMNYFQLLSFGVPILFYFMVTSLPEHPRELLKKIASLFIPWCIGYAGMMVFKWVMYCLVVDRGIIHELIDAILLRSDTDQGARFKAILTNITVGFRFNKPWVIVELIFIAWCLRKLLRVRDKISISRTDLLLLFMMTAIPFCRYMLFANHVIIHRWVTYRLLMMPILTFNLLAVKAIYNGFRKKLKENGPSKAKGYILDVDGTLYSQTKLRCAMIWRLLRYYLRRPLRCRDLFVIYYFRKMRKLPENKAATIEELYGEVALKTHLPETSVTEIIQKWMFQVPLDLIRRYSYKELIEFINLQHAKGKKVAVYSDYPAEEKVKAAGLDCDAYFISNTGNLTEQKPSPSDARLILDAMELPSDSLLYIGDRENKDRASAELMKVSYYDISHIRELLQFAINQ